MKIPRRKLLHLAAGAAAAPLFPQLASALDYPNRPVRIVIGYPPGSSPDIAGRLMGQWLSDRLGQQFVVENKPGGGTNLSTEAVVRAAPDGYTLLLISAGNAINTSLYDNLNFDFGRDIAPVAGVVGFPMVITVRSQFPAKTLPDLIAYAKDKPGKLNLGTPPIGSPQDVAAELLKMQTATNFVIVPYRGGPPALSAAKSTALSARCSCLSISFAPAACALWR